MFLFLWDKFDDQVLMPHRLKTKDFKNHKVVSQIQSKSPISIKEYISGKGSCLGRVQPAGLDKLTEHGCPEGDAVELSIGDFVLNASHPSALVGSTDTLHTRQNTAHLCREARDRKTKNKHNIKRCLKSTSLFPFAPLPPARVCTHPSSITCSPETRHLFRMHATSHLSGNLSPSPPPHAPPQSPPLCLCAVASAIHHAHSGLHYLSRLLSLTLCLVAFITCTFDCNA